MVAKSNKNRVQNLIALIFLLLVQGVFGQAGSKKLLHIPVQIKKPTQPRTLSNDERLFRTAQAYLSMKRYDQAIRILEKLRQKNPQNNSYYRSLFRTYQIVGKTQKADSLVKIMLRKFPENQQFKVDQANILFKLDDKPGAFALWNQVLKTNSNNVNIYIQVANSMLENKLYDEAIHVYQQAIVKIPKTDYLYQTIASIYQNRLMYQESVRFLLKYLEIQPNRQLYVFNRILSFRVEPEDRPALFTMLENELKKFPHPDDIRLLIAQLHQRYGELEEAFRVYQQLEIKQKDAKYLLQFARSAQADSSFEIAVKAYDLVMRRYPQDKQLMTAYHGAVASLFQLTEKNNGTQYARRALTLIDQAQQKFPGNRALPGLLYLKGIFKLNYFFDVDAAIAIFSGLGANPQIAIRYSNDSLIKLGECFLMKGELENAEKSFRKITREPQLNFAQLQISRTFYFMKKWEKSTEILDKLIQKAGAGGEVTNDALKLKLRLALAQTAPAILELLSEADLLVYQRKNSEAVEKLNELLSVGDMPAAVKSEVYSEVAHLSLDLSEIPRALDYCTEAISDSNLSLYADQHLFLLATILDRNLKRYNEAFKTYQELLQNYPNSLFVDRARERIKYLKDEKLIELP